MKAERGDVLPVEVRDDFWSGRDEPLPACSSPSRISLALTRSQPMRWQIDARALQYVYCIHALTGRRAHR